jgi:3-deoxy-manno-octulosonate cytidylyltransferase (CMP-KDO synthetase)
MRQGCYLLPPDHIDLKVCAVMSTLVLIPARLAATRLPNKPLALLAGEPMIVHVWRRAVEAEVGPVAVAADSPLIIEAVERAGGTAVLTRADHPSGSDRICEALHSLDSTGKITAVINVQGDLPTIDPAIVRKAAQLLDNPAVDLGTLGAIITREDERGNPNVVKIVGSSLSTQHLRALYFTRAAAPWGPGELIHHIGLYAWRRAALEKFVILPPSPLELREKLEQLRALEAGMRIDVALVDDIPLGVDTPHDLERARLILEGNTP